MTTPRIAATPAPTSIGTTQEATLTSAGSRLRDLPAIFCCNSIAMYAARRNSEPWAMLTVRIKPKISVKPEATTNISPANVTPSSSVITKSPGSATADPDDVPVAKNSTQLTTNTIGRPTTMAGSRRLQLASIHSPS